MSDEEKKRDQEFNQAPLYEGAMIAIEFPLVLPSVANLREHWAKKAKRVKVQRSATRIYMSASRLAIINEPGIGPDGLWPRCSLSVRLTRVAPRTLDGDNLQAAFKAVRDEIAAYLGIDDGDERIRFTYAQAKGKAAVRIELSVEPSPRLEVDWVARGMPLEYTK